MEREIPLSSSQETATEHNPEPDESNPHPYYMKSILILSSHFPNGLLPSSSPTQTLYTYLIPSIHATCPALL